LRTLLKTGTLMMLGTITALADPSAILTGFITDPAGRPVSDTTVVITNLGTNITSSIASNGVGLYTSPPLEPGLYRMAITKDGFKTIVKSGIELHIQDTISVNFSLEIGSVSESVTVAAGASAINTTDASVSTVIERQFVESLPMNGRSFQSLITIAPGVVATPGASTGSKGQFSVNGQRTEANYYTVDGVSANNGSSPISGGIASGFSGNVPNETALGTTHSLVSLDALQEFRMQTSSYSAEYGRTPGAQISLVTRSGTNDLHATAFDYLRNGVFDANNWFNNFHGIPRTSERQNDFGGTLGGPVLIPSVYNGRDRTFFFFSYEGLRLSTPQPAQTTLVPDSALRQTAAAPLRLFLNANPVPNGPSNGNGSAYFTAAYSSPGTVDATSIRIDHALNSKLLVFGRYSDSASDTTVRGGNSASLNVLSTNSQTVKSLTLGTTAVLTPHFTNEFRFNRSWTKGRTLEATDNFGGAVPFAISDVRDVNGQANPLFDAISFCALFPDATWCVSLGHNFRDDQRQLNVVNLSNYTFRTHSLKYGIDYRRLVTPYRNYQLDALGFFLSPASMLQNAPSASLRASAPLEKASVYDNLSLFIQDEWKTTRRLTLSLGLRRELNPAPGDAHGNLPYTVDQVTNLATTALAPKGTPLWKTTYKNFAPRLGLAYQLGQKSGRETVLRGGFGVFYDTGNTYASQGYGGVGLFARPSLGSLPFPYTTDQTKSVLSFSTASPYNSVVFGFDPHLQLPYTLQWNVALEQAVGHSQTLTMSYLGAAGRRLLWARQIHPAALGNPNFTTSNSLDLTTNASTSDYSALQVQFRRRLSSGLQALGSYTWSHSIDDTSTNFLIQQLLRGSSDFDIRHNFQLAVTYELPSRFRNQLANALSHGWSLDGRIAGRRGLPFDVTGGTIFVSSGLQTNLRANVIPGQPIYVDDSNAPGGRRVNFDAFRIPTAAQQAAEQYGDAPRNLLRGFSVGQVDVALNRQFNLRESLKLRFRVEAFNVLNHPIFGTIQNNLTTGRALFGLATGTANSQIGGLSPLYQIGGPRSLQLSMRLQF